MFLKVLVLLILIAFCVSASSSGSSKSGSSKSSPSKTGSTKSGSSNSGSSKSKSGSTLTSTSGSSKPDTSKSTSSQSASSKSGSSKTGSKSTSSKSDTSKSGSSKSKTTSPHSHNSASVKPAPHSTASTHYHHSSSVEPVSHSAASPNSHHSASVKPAPHSTASQNSHHSASVKPAPHSQNSTHSQHPTTPQPNGPPAPSHHVSEKLKLKRPIYQFAIEFFGNVTTYNEKETFVVSPLATLTQLALLTTVSNGQTERCLNTALHLGHSNSTITSEFHGLLKPLQNSDDINIGSEFYIRKGYTVRPTFLKEAAKFYTQVYMNNFDAKGAIKINQRASNQTYGKIPSIISADEFTTYTTLLLINAVYFNAGWMYPFSASETKAATFKKGSCKKSNSKKVQMMNQVGTFRYGLISSLNAYVLELPFIQSNLTMFVILPKKCDGMKDLMTRWHGFDVNKLGGQKYETVKVSLPKFSIDFTTNLNDAFTTMGLGNIIANTADFQRILIIPSYSSYQQLYIADAIHGVSFNVDETGMTGSEAKSAASQKSGSSTKTFNANHSFIFCVTTPQSVVLMGKYEG